MPKETKERLTRQRICADLKGKLGREMRLSIAFYIVWLLIFALLALVFSLVADAVWTWLFCIIPLPCIVYAICCACKRSRMIENGEYTVVEDRLDQMSELERDRAFSGLIYGRLFPTLSRGNVFHFSCYGKYALPFPPRGRFAFAEGEHDYFSLSSNDDIFYLVIYNDHKQFPVAVYPAKIYEWKD